MQWNAETDMFTFKLNPPQDFVYTKRGFLKKLALLFDPAIYLLKIDRL